MEALHGDCEVLGERVDRFIRESAVVVRALVTAWARSDARAVAKAARDLARHSASVGAARLRAMCLALEASMTDELLLEALGRELASVELELRQLVDGSVPRFI